MHCASLDVQAEEEFLNFLPFVQLNTFYFKVPRLKESNIFISTLTFSAFFHHFVFKCNTPCFGDRFDHLLLTCFFQKEDSLLQDGSDQKVCDFVCHTTSSEPYKTKYFTLILRHWYFYHSHRKTSYEETNSFWIFRLVQGKRHAGRATAWPTQFLWMFDKKT
jgi:hypothetical protein